jgi:hypothetical protein
VADDTHHEVESLVVAERDPQVVEVVEEQHRRERGALVAVDERVIAGERRATLCEGGAMKVAGPRQEQLVDMATRLAARRGDPVQVRAAPDDNAHGRAAATGALLPGPNTSIIGPTFEQWLDAGERES